MEYYKWSFACSTIRQWDQNIPDTLYILFLKKFLLETNQSQALNMFKT